MYLVFSELYIVYINILKISRLANMHQSAKDFYIDFYIDSASINYSFASNRCARAELVPKRYFSINAVSMISVLGKNTTPDQRLALPLALLGRAEIFMALKEYHFALEDLRLAAEHDVPDETM